MRLKWYIEIKWGFHGFQTCFYFFMFGCHQCQTPVMMYNTTSTSSFLPKEAHYLHQHGLLSNTNPKEAHSLHQHGLLSTQKEIQIL